MRFIKSLIVNVLKEKDSLESEIKNLDLYLSLQKKRLFDKRNKSIRDDILLDICKKYNIKLRYEIELDRLLDN